MIMKTSVTVLLYRKRVSSALYTKQSTEPYSHMCWGESNTVTPKRNDKEKQRKQMPTTADQQKRRSLTIAAPTRHFH